MNTPMPQTPKDIVKLLRLNESKANPYEAMFSYATDIASLRSLLDTYEESAKGYKYFAEKNTLMADAIKRRIIELEPEDI